MSSSAAVNVLRYSALGLGLFYGFTHQRKITSTQKAEADQREYQRKEALINKAKAEYARSKSPISATTAGGDPATRDPNSPKFDLEAAIQSFLGDKA
ncbi:unnamed protein product [Parascedosporium putredinis]|uniref:ATP synthase F(0) complex subunit e, mitochondrial n=1 Tax=Parascedosporium putredinis TaxID=1442378 RepID=A0A9P1H757_9PEZI|nr:unnamed protein product [Parascedosporium putredinis]CAI7998615.1 unnamed protein product [Parascedosporium putredinis]